MRDYYIQVEPQSDHMTINLILPILNSLLKWQKSFDYIVFDSYQNILLIRSSSRREEIMQNISIISSANQASPMECEVLKSQQSQDG